MQQGHPIVKQYVTYAIDAPQTKREEDWPNELLIVRLKLPRRPQSGPTQGTWQRQRQHPPCRPHRQRPVPAPALP